MLRLIEPGFSRSDRSGCRVLMTAFTNAAVDTFARKFNELLRLLKQLKSLAGDAWQNSEWLDELGEVTFLRETNVEESPEGAEGEDGQERNTDSASRKPTTSSSRRLPPLPKAKYGIWAGTVWMIQKK
ncbi:hypothetical protein M427DRAFT_355347 [Gonapodya prolifera JEL478]|uniref:Uncharacterized protein n=1 Tax=Gonapodya prolifera (strain JEL478) TaxID=1344416 RepID=A0A139ABK2_GONPJ|nr:hypothetical protein M427DRAFT_355347 [Gonapodya prolifera JEL478]|eukprot:KXS14171.1 hypothetical protein M427DRAFT_355347 [Gonapodya prolifera JEL478]